MDARTTRIEVAGHILNLARISDLRGRAKYERGCFSPPPHHRRPSPMVVGSRWSVGWPIRFVMRPMSRNTGKMAGFAWDNGWATSGEEQMKLRQARAAPLFLLPGFALRGGRLPGARRRRGLGRRRRIAHRLDRGDGEAEQPPLSGDGHIDHLEVDLLASKGKARRVVFSRSGSIWRLRAAVMRRASRTAREFGDLWRLRQGQTHQAPMRQPRRFLAPAAGQTP
jgi:hypothetical protein